MLNKRHFPFIFNLFMAIGMSFFMSLILTILNLGIQSDFFVVWLKAWGLALICAVPISFAIAPFVRQASMKLCKAHNE